MIKTQLLVPNVYYRDSRDFQFLGRLYDYIFNYLKASIDSMNTFPLNNTDQTTFYELILRTLGFFVQGNYDMNNLRGVASSYSHIIKNKGSLTGITSAVITVLRAQGIGEKVSITINKDYNNQNVLTVRVGVRDLLSSDELNLLDEIFNYILPAGMNYYIQNVAVIDGLDSGKLYYRENMHLSKVKNNQTSSITKFITDNRGTKDTINEDNKLVDIETDTPYLDEENRLKKENSDIKIGSLKVGTIAKKRKK